MLGVLTGVAASAPLQNETGNRIGVENGVAYNTSIDVTPNDGMTDREWRLLTARTKARIEVLSRSEFPDHIAPDVDSITPRSHRQQSESVAASMSPRRITWLQARYQTTLLLNRSTSVRARFGPTFTRGTQAYYTPSTDEVRLVRNRTEGVSEPVLAQELFHAYQHEVGDWERSDRLDRSLAQDAVIEGAANRLETEYRERCETEWDCLSKQDVSPVEISDQYRPIYLLMYFPYSEGPAYVQPESRWEPDPGRYDALPQSTASVLGANASSLVRVRVPDRSTDAWEPVDGPAGVSGERIGQVAIGMMFYAPAMGGSGSPGEYGFPTREEFVAPVESNTQRTFEYRSNYSEGWVGGYARYYRSTTGDGIASVWRTRWESHRDAEVFARGYRQLLAYYGATLYENDTARFAEDGRFEGAIRINRSGSVVTVTRAPSFEEITRVTGSENGGIPVNSPVDFSSGIGLCIAGIGLFALSKGLETE